MSNSVIFKTIRTYRHPYLYDRHTNSIIMLTEDEYNELSLVEKGSLQPDQSAAVTKYQEQGLLVPNVVKKIEHPGTLMVEHYLNTRMKQLVLQVTQQCNLRCEYCSYSGIYKRSRTHTSMRMNADTAKTAIDFFLQHSNESVDIHISFYGGEPLLEFDLIRQCVAYTNDQVEGRRVHYNITTNGTLLSDDVVDFFVNNDFTLAISLDGSREEHNINRKYANGDGSFDIIIDNIRRIHARHPTYKKMITIMTTINPHIDIGCILEYFHADDVLNDSNIMFNMMNEMDLKPDLLYEEKYYRIRNYEYVKMLFSLVGKLEKKHTSQLVFSSWSTLRERQRQIRGRGEMSSLAHHGGPCRPGVHRLFVRADGELYPCERVSDVLDYFKIGTLENGLDIKQIWEIMNVGKLTEYECINCWNLRLCSICSAQLEFSTEPTRQHKLQECIRSEARALFELYELAVLYEFGLDIESIEESL